MQYLDFEKNLEELEDQLEKIIDLGKKNNVDMSNSIRDLTASIKKTKEEIYHNLTPWQRVQLSRHPDRPYTLDYIEAITDSFTELFGDRGIKDDKAIVGGMATIDSEPVMIIGQQKGHNTKERQLRNFGMANPEGYRKALRLMKLAEKFNRPIICLIDTPGAYPGLEAEERGQGEAIARNLFEMINLRVPTVCIIIGEGASGGALGIGVGDRIAMLENTWYSVISPENCSTILWRSWDYKVQAAKQLKLTSKDMKGFGLVDDVLEEPLGGAHTDPEKMAASMKEYILSTLKELSKMDADKRIEARINHFSSMGFFEEVEESPKKEKRKKETAETKKEKKDSDK